MIKSLAAGTAMLSRGGFQPCSARGQRTATFVARYPLCGPLLPFEYLATAIVERNRPAQSGHRPTSPRRAILERLPQE